MSVNKKNSDGSYNQYASKPYVTKDNIGLSRVENKSSEDIRGEITSKNVTDALGYTPVNPNPQFIYDTEAKMTKVVPENVNKGIVAMIGGKTQKVVQLIDSKDESITPTKPYDILYNDLSDKIANNNNHVYYVSSYINGGVNVTLGYGNPSTSSQNKKIATNISTTYPKRFSGVFTNDISASSHYIFVIEMGSSDFKKITVTNTMVVDLTVMFGTGKEPTVEQFESMFPDYIPYTEGSLWNAPVTEVTSVGKNRFDGNLTIGYFDPIGQYVRDERYRCFIAELEPGTYTINGSMNETLYWIRYLVDDEQTTIASTNPTFQLTLTQRKAVKFVFRNNATTTSLTNIKIQIERGSSATPYTPYRKTSIPIPSAILNLPDYGCSAGDVYNYVDFEEMVYHHRVAKVNLSMNSWLRQNDWNAWYTTEITDFKKGTVNAVSEKYETTVIKNIENKAVTNAIGFTAASGSNTVACNNNSTIDKPVGILNYELAEEELIPLADLLMPFMLESGGTITFENEHNLDVPNTVIYEKEMK